MDTAGGEGVIPDDNVGMPFTNRYVGDSNQVLLLVGPSMAFEMIVQFVFAAVEFLDAVIPSKDPDRSRHPLGTFHAMIIRGARPKEVYIWLVKL